MLSGELPAPLWKEVKEGCKGSSGRKIQRGKQKENMTDKNW